MKLYYYTGLRGPWSLTERIFTLIDGVPYFRDVKEPDGIYCDMRPGDDRNNLALLNNVELVGKYFCPVDSLNYNEMPDNPFLPVAETAKLVNFFTAAIEGGRIRKITD